MTFEEITGDPALKAFEFMRTDRGVLYNAACLKFMQSLPDKCVDLVLTDPPYGVGENYTQFNDTPENLKSIIDEFMPEVLRISKVAAISTGVKNMFLYPRPTWVLNWHTPAGSGVGPWGFCTWQPILVYGKDPYMSNGMGSRPDVIVHTETAEKNGHPCPKPERLWSKLLNRVCVCDTDVVFDCFMGSGTTALVCEKKGLKWFGCEISEAYCQIAAERIRTEAAQGKLF